MEEVLASTNTHLSLDQCVNSRCPHCFSTDPKSFCTVKDFADFISVNQHFQMLMYLTLNYYKLQPEMTGVEQCACLTHVIIEDRTKHVKVFVQNGSISQYSLL